MAILAQKMSANGVEFQWEPEANLSPIVGSENRLRTMIKQVIENAIEAMSDNRQKPRILKVNSKNMDDFVALHIADTGCGIDADQSLKVFEPFYSTKISANNGRGMGLTMVQEIVNEHAGTVTLTTSQIEIEGQDTASGCEVVIHLPVTNDNL